MLFVRLFVYASLTIIIFYSTQTPTVKYDVEMGKEVTRVKAHGRNNLEGRINRMRFNRDKSLFITASRDYSAKLMDPVTLEVVKVVCIVCIVCCTFVRVCFM